MTLLVLFGGAEHCSEQLHQLKPSARVMEEEGVLMQALAEADEELRTRFRMMGPSKLLGGRRCGVVFAGVSAVLRVVGNLSKPLETPLDLSPYP